MPGQRGRPGSRWCVAYRRRRAQAFLPRPWIASPPPLRPFQIAAMPIRARPYSRVHMTLTTFSGEQGGNSKRPGDGGDSAGNASGVVPGQPGTTPVAGTDDALALSQCVLPQVPALLVVDVGSTRN